MTVRAALLLASGAALPDQATLAAALQAKLRHLTEIRLPGNMDSSDTFVEGARAEDIVGGASATASGTGMMSRVMPKVNPGALLCPVFVTLLGTGLWSLWRPVLASPVGSDKHERFPALHMQGVASCAAVACHGGNGPPGAVGSEYTTWATLDPHARAYSTLFGPRSQRIQEILNQSAVPEKRTSAEKNPLCLRCHAVDPAVAHLSPGVDLADGVGCESCHGPAEKWRARHYLPEWKRLGPREKAGLGFADTRDLVVRAEVCAGCHVGDGDREVNHDLIAAGHPRLRFELAGYLANYPRHWPAKHDTARYPDFEARAWAVGQVVSAIQGLELLQERASHPAKPWPEFAEYECASCHFRLKEVRQRPIPADRKPRTPLWGSWYYSLLEELKPEGQNGLAFSGLKQELNEELSNLLPGRTRTAEKAAQAARELSAWLPALDRRGEKDPAPWARLLARLTEPREAALDQAGWDEAGQRYLALAAVYQGLAGLDPKCQSPAARKILQDMAGQLRRAFPEGRESKYDSPTQFKPGLLKGDLERLRNLVIPPPR